MKLASVLNVNLIFCNVAGAGRRELYGNLLRLASPELHLPIPAGELLDGIIEREDATGMPYDGVAVPHFRLDGLDDLYLIIGIPARPLLLRDGDSAPTSIVLLSLIRPDTSDTYLKALAAFSRYTAIPANREKLAAERTPEGVLRRIDEDRVTLKKTITAEDLMTAPSQTVHPDDNLAVALDIFNTVRRTILPVVDDDGKLVGELDATEVIRRFIPEYIFMMESTRFMVSFEPFDAIFREEQTHTVRELMQPPKLVIDKEMPLIRFTIALAKRTAGLIFVADEAGKLLGEISVKNIIHKVLRG